VWAARTDRAWALPIACMLAMPVVRGGAFSLLLAVIPLLAHRGNLGVRTPLPVGPVAHAAT
jgi:hypothetical protein